MRRDVVCLRICRPRRRREIAGCGAGDAITEAQCPSHSSRVASVIRITPRILRLQARFPGFCRKPQGRSIQAGKNRHSAGMTAEKTSGPDQRADSHGCVRAGRAKFPLSRTGLLRERNRVLGRRNNGWMGVQACFRLACTRCLCVGFGHENAGRTFRRSETRFLGGSIPFRHPSPAPP